MNTELRELRAYVSANDGLTGLAAVLGVTKAVVWAWIDRGQAPVERCHEIERVTGVRRWYLRPDDWHLIWPELIGRPGAPRAPKQGSGRHAAAEASRR